MVTIKCKRCKKKFDVLPCNVKRGRKFCSEKCQNNVPKVFIICKHCKNKKQVKPYLKSQEYCSPQCKNESKRLTVPCTTCGKKITKRQSFIARYKLHFCSKKCNTTTIKKGTKPWNKGVSVRLSPKSEFKKGLIPMNKLPIGTERIRKDHKKRNTPKRAWVKIAEPSVWKSRARWVWENCYGALSRGYIIHHKDRNALNDDIDNLDALTRAEHINEHRHELR